MTSSLPGIAVVGQFQRTHWRSFVIHHNVLRFGAPVGSVLLSNTVGRRPRKATTVAYRAATRCRAVSLARHQVMNARAATATPNCAAPPLISNSRCSPTAFGPQMQSSTLRVVPTSRRALCPRRRNIRPLPLPSQFRASRSTNRILLGPPMTVFEVHGLERLRHTMQPLPIDLATDYQRRGVRVASDFLVRRQARWIARLCGAK